VNKCRQRSFCRVRNTTASVVESLESRAYLSGVAGASPVTDVTAARAGRIVSFDLAADNQNAVPPSASVDLTQPPGSDQSNVYDFLVTYTDPVAVDVTTLGNSNLIVTFPNDSQSEAATLVSTGLTDGPVVQATYQITFAHNLTAADIGSYQVSINSNSVQDTTGLAVPAGSIGSFALSIGADPPTGDFAVSAPTGKFPTSVVSGSSQKGGASVVVTYNGTATLKNAVVTTTLYASATQINDASAVQVGKAVTERIGKLKPGMSLHIHLAPFAYPETAGADYLVSDVALNGALDSYDGATPAPINVQAAFVDADALVAVPAKATLVAGKRASALFTIENLGNIAIAGHATVDVGVVPAGSPAGTTPTSIALAIPVTLHLNAGQTRTVRVSFLPTTLPAAGSYELSLQINVAGDTVTSNDTVFSTALITI
jgi:hypothetical protein